MGMFNVDLSDVKKALDKNDLKRATVQLNKVCNVAFQLSQGADFLKAHLSKYNYFLSRANQIIQKDPHVAKDQLDFAENNLKEAERLTKALLAAMKKEE